MFELLLAFFGFGSRPKASIACTRKSDFKAAIVFVHGFTGSGATTWTELLPRIEAQADLKGWDVCTISYATSLNLDISGLWAADAESEDAGSAPGDGSPAALASYDTLVLIAHSMGGLVRAASSPRLSGACRRTRSVILLGTPSNGLKKSSGAGYALETAAERYGLGGPFWRRCGRTGRRSSGIGPPFSFPYRRRGAGPVRPDRLLACAISPGQQAVGRPITFDAFAGGG